MERIELLTDAHLERKLKRCLQRNFLPDQFLYLHNTGVQNWLTLESSPQFKVAASLTAFLKENVTSVTDYLPPSLTLLSIGPGDAQKEEILLQTLKPRRLACHLADVSNKMLDTAAARLTKAGFQTRTFTADFAQLPKLIRYCRQPVLLTMLGNNFCNYQPPRLIDRVKNSLTKDDFFLFDCELLGPNNGTRLASIKKNYRCPENVRFNTAVLTERGICPEDIEFELNLPCDGDHCRTEKHIQVKRNCSAHVNHETINFSAGQTIKMGFTWKYRPEILRTILEPNFRIKRWIVSPNHDRLLALIKPGDKNAT